MKENLNALLILNIFFCVFSFFMDLDIWFGVTIVNLCLVWWLRGKENDKLLENKNYFLYLGIFDFITLKILSGSMCISTYMNLKNEKKFRIFRGEIRPKEKVKVDPQIKKIDILLKLGVLLVFIAGFVFATTGWYSLNSIIKVFIFLVIALIFIGLSKFCEKHIKIKSTVYLYYLLGMSFLLLMILTIGYGEVFGKFFSLVGEGKLLYYSFSSLFVSCLGLVTYFNFKEKMFLNIVYAGVFFAVICGFQYIPLATETIFAIILPILTIIRFIRINKESDLYTLSIFSDLLIIVLAIAYICFSTTYFSVLPVLISSSLFVCNLYWYIYNNKESDFSMFATLIAYVMIIPLLLIIANDINLWVIITVLFVTFLYLIALVFDCKKLKASSLVFADIITILAFVISSEGNVWLPLIVAALSTIVCIACTFIDDLDEYSFEVFVHPVKLGMLIYGSMVLLETIIELVSPLGYFMSITLLTYILIYCLSKNKTLINIYEKFTILALIINLLSVSLINNLGVTLIVFVSSLLFYADVNWTKQKSNEFKNFMFIGLLVSVYICMFAIESSLVSYDVGIGSNYLFTNIVVILIYVLMAIFHKKDELRKNISLFAVVIPLYAIVETNIEIDWVNLILPSVLVYYLTFVLCHINRENYSVRNLIGYIGYSYSFLLVVFSDNYYVLGYTFIILLVSLLLGYFDKTFNSLFKVSVGGFIIFIIYQLKEFWHLIPAWLYILAVGIGLIGFATYKQLSLAKNNDKDGKR